LDDYCIESRDSTVISVEKIETPLPTEPGSVILCTRFGTYHMRTASGWVGEFGDLDTTESLGHSHEHRVVFDAGVSS
jgi:hypothetical protein